MAAAVGHLHPDKAVPRADRDRDRPARSARPACRTLLLNSSLTSRAASSPHGCPGPSTPIANARAIRARSARPATVTLSRICGPAISAPAFPGRPAPGKSPGPAGRVYGDARLTQRFMSSRNTRPGRPVRGCPWKADGAHRPSWRPDAVRYMSVDTATRRRAALQGDTQRDREETARIAEASQLAGRFRRWWQVLGSNQRRLSRRFYRPLPLATRETCRAPPVLVAQRRIAQDATTR